MIVGHRFREFVVQVEDVQLGRDVVADGRLIELRADLGLSRQAMAELLHTSTIVYTTWETRSVRLWPSTAERVGRFFRLALTELAFLEQSGESLQGLLPLYLAASNVGVPQELFLSWYRDGHFEAVDLGILGLWVHTTDVERIRNNPSRP